MLELSARCWRRRATIFSTSAARKARAKSSCAPIAWAWAIHSLYLLTETDLDHIFQQISELKPTLVVIDSIQTTRVAELDSSPGLVSQVRECAIRLQSLAKQTGLSVLMIGHVTKDGHIAGPRTLEHIVDAVLYLEGDPFGQYRLLRGVKNRFGATSEVGVFEMRGSGLGGGFESIGSLPLKSASSTRPVPPSPSRWKARDRLLVELQALTSPTAFGNPRRTPNGIDMNRLLLDQRRVE